MKQMKKLLVILGVLMFMVGTVSIAAAIPVTATLTADNHYALYYGNGGGVNFVGNNESGAAGSPGTYNWSEAETLNFDVPSGDYIYVAAWNDGSYYKGLIGQFDFGFGPLLTTNDTTDWQVHSTSTFLGDGSSPPSVGDIGTETAGVWDPITNSAAHGVYPWGTIAGISSGAQWIWGSALGSDEIEPLAYQIFRTQVPVAPVPEPATMLLLGTGLIGLAGVGRRKFKKNNMV